jgi:hypothetical protein
MKEAFRKEINDFPIGDVLSADGERKNGWVLQVERRETERVAGRIGVLGEMNCAPTDGRLVGGEVK